LPGALSFVLSGNGKESYSHILDPDMLIRIITNIYQLQLSQVLPNTIISTKSGCNLSLYKFCQQTNRQINKQMLGIT